MSDIRALYSMDDFRKLAAEVGVDVPSGPGRFPREAVQVAANRKGIYLDLSNLNSKPTQAKKINHVVVSALVDGQPKRLLTSSQEVREAAGQDPSKRGATSLNQYAAFAAKQWGTEVNATDIMVFSATPELVKQIQAENGETEKAVAAETVAKPRKAARKGKDTSKTAEAVSEAVSPVAE